MFIVRRIGALVLLAAAVAVWFAMAPEEADVDHSSDVAGIEAEDKGNNALAEGAPQQTVVNGWTEHNYLALISEQLDEAASAGQRDDRPAAMLGLCVAGIALLALTSPGTAPRSESPEAVPPAD